VPPSRVPPASPSAGRFDVPPSGRYDAPASRVPPAPPSAGRFDVPPSGRHDVPASRVPPASTPRRAPEPGRPGDALPPVRVRAEVPDEERDTEADTPEAADEQRRRRHRVPARRPTTRAPAESPDEVVDEGPPITSVAQGRLADVRLHETKVRRRSSTIAGRRPSSTSGAPLRGFTVELVRSLDASQTIHRTEQDELIIEGLATGAIDPEARAPTVSVMVDGTVYAVGVEPGDSARETADRLRTRLERALKVELVAADDQRAVLRVVGLGAPG
jgi:hypothetical protein